MNRFKFISVFLTACFILAAAVGFAQNPTFNTSHLDACNASANGSITITVTSSVGTTSYNIISGLFNVGPITFVGSVTVSGLAGTVGGRPYFVIVSDDNGSDTKTETIKLYNNVSGSTVVTDVTTCTPLNGAIHLPPSRSAPGPPPPPISYPST